MIITKEWILNFIKTRIKSQQPVSITAMSVRDVLIKMVDYVDGMDGTIGTVYELIIKGSGNSTTTNEEGDWKITTDPATNNLQKYKRQGGIWILVEEDVY